MKVYLGNEHISQARMEVTTILDGVDTSTDTVTADVLLKDYTAHDKDGNVVTGNIAINSSSDITANGATVNIPAGYYESASNKSVATATQATPSISVDAAGLITASSVQNAGYVEDGTKSATKQLTVQETKTVTPTTSEQTAVASGMYTTGAVKVAAIPSKYVDTSNDTVTADRLVEGATAHDAAGNPIQGLAGARVEGNALILNGTVTGKTLEWEGYQWPILVKSS